VPSGDYVSVIVHRGIAYVSGQVPRRGDELGFTGKMAPRSISRRRSVPPRFAPNYASLRWRKPSAASTGSNRFSG
jgi:hypothetical protein